jgi:hypothetical protein
MAVRNPFRTIVTGLKKKKGAPPPRSSALFQGSQDTRKVPSLASHNCGPLSLSNLRISLPWSGKDLQEEGDCRWPARSVNHGNKTNTEQRKPRVCCHPFLHSRTTTDCAQAASQGARVEPAVFYHICDLCYRPKAPSQVLFLVKIGQALEDAALHLQRWHLGTDSQQVVWRDIEHCALYPHSTGLWRRLVSGFIFVTAILSYLASSPKAVPHLILRPLPGILNPP